MKGMPDSGRTYLAERMAAQYRAILIDAPTVIEKEIVRLIVILITDQTWSKSWSKFEFARTLQQYSQEETTHLNHGVDMLKYSERNDM